MTLRRIGRLLTGRYPLAVDLGLLLLRLFIGCGIAAHGAQKLGLIGGGGISQFVGFLESLHVPHPLLMAYLAAGSEFLGGLALAAGFLTRLSWIPPTIAMAVAIITVHLHHGYFAQGGGFEYPLNLAAVFVGLGIIGAGRFSCDGLLGRWLERGSAGTEP